MSLIPDAVSLWRCGLCWARCLPCVQGRVVDAFLGARIRCSRRHACGCGDSATHLLHDFGAVILPPSDSAVPHVKWRLSLFSSLMSFCHPRKPPWGHATVYELRGGAVVLKLLVRYLVNLHPVRALYRRSAPPAGSQPMMVATQSSFTKVTHLLRNYLGLFLVRVPRYFPPGECAYQYL